MPWQLLQLGTHPRLAATHPWPPPSPLLLPRTTSKEKERQQAAAAADAGGPQPRSRLAEAAAEFAEAPQAYLLSSPSGLGVGAEAAIEQAIKDGALDNLPGRGEQPHVCALRRSGRARSPPR